MSDLRKRFEKETGKKVEITSHFDCEDSDCDADVGVDIWNNEYIMWLENLANGKITEQNKVLHLRGVVGSALDTEFLQALNDLIDRKIGNEPTKERF